MLAVVIVVVAMRASSADPSQPRDTVGVEATPTKSTSAKPGASASGKPSGAPSTDASLPDAWFTSLRFGTLVRAPVGECTVGAPALTVSTSGDGGRTFTAAEVTDLAAVTGINIVSRDEATIVGADFKCEVATFQTVDGGKSWTQRYTSPKFWSLLAGIEGQIQSPAGRVDVPCVPKAVSGIDGNVSRLWCADGQLLGTATAGASWITLGRVPEGYAMVFPTLASGYVLGKAPDCTGTTVLTTEDAGAHWDPVHCSTVDGPWGVAADGRTVVVSGDNTADASLDGGRTWATR
jgi:hypothetical protein